MPNLNDTDWPRIRKSEVRRRFSAQTNPRRVQTVRMLAAQTEWLEGPLRWEDGRVQWSHARGLLAPTAADLSSAQRALYQIARYPHASDRAFGDGSAWLSRRLSQLDLAKRLHVIYVPDLSLLASDRSPEALCCLVELVLTEALCINALPVSPSRTLVRRAACSPEVTGRLLRELIDDVALPRAARALAAVTLGAANHSGELPAPRGWLPGLEVSLRQAWQRGMRSGLPEEPGLALSLLLDGGPELLERWRAARALAPHFVLPGDSLQSLLAAGAEPQRVVELCESMAGPQRLCRRLKSQVAAELEEVAARFEIHPGQMRAWRQEWPRRCEDNSAALADVVLRAALTTGDPEAPRLMVTLIDQILELQGDCADYIAGQPGSPADGSIRQRRRCHRPGSVRALRFRRTFQCDTPVDIVSLRDPTASMRALETLCRFALHLLRKGEQLPAGLRVPWLRLVVNECAAWWKPEGLVWGRKSRTARQRTTHLDAWLRRRCEKKVPPLSRLLRRCESSDVCREALHAGVHERLAAFRFRDPALYAYAVQLNGHLQPFRYPHQLHRVCRYLALFSDAGEARGILGPVVEITSVVPRELRGDAFHGVLCALGRTRHAATCTLPRITPHLKYLFELLAGSRRTGQAYGAVNALLALDAERRYRKGCNAVLRVADEIESRNEHTLEIVDLADAACTASSSPDATSCDEEVPFDYWLTCLLDETNMVQRDCEAAKRPANIPLGLLTRLCAQLADGDFDFFRNSLCAAARCEISDTATVRRGLDELRRYPRLSQLMSQSLAAQPGRVLKLITRLAYASRLCAEALHPLEVWRVAGEARAAPEGDGICNLPAEWQAVVLFAPEMGGLATEYVDLQQICEEPAGVPAGVSRALNLPRKLEAELDHVEQLLAAHPGRCGLAKRAATLRSRILDRETLRRKSIDEACERMNDALREARLRAVEQSLESCFRRQLERLVGLLPRELTMDDDWFNAVLLSVDIDCNRRLMRHMLRAEADGDRAWRERRPANITFLRELSERGIDVNAWNGTHRKRYRYSSSGDGWMHLCVEHNPLKILQMGNAFGTCLSVGGCNSFSTVANACEANKRVIFARDGAGRIVARKLLAVNAEGRLVGFHTYAGGANNQANRALRAAVSHYARGFAARCGLQLADGGNVPCLFADDWYDDGTVSWSQDESEGPHAASVTAKVQRNRRLCKIRGDQRIK